MGFHLKGGSALIWQIFSFCNQKIGNFFVISTFLVQVQLNLLKLLEKFAKFSISKLIFKNLNAFLNLFLQTWNKGSTERRIFQMAVNEH
jgi:hypothetical protein